MSDNRVLYHVVKIRDVEYVAADLANNYMHPRVVCTEEIAKSAHFTRDMARRVANFLRDNANGCRARVARVVDKKNPPVAKAPEKTVHLALILDNSGSMAPVADAAKKAFNDILNENRDASKTTGVSAVASMWLCGQYELARSAAPYYVLTKSLSTEVVECYVGKPIAEANPIVAYNPNGNTPLLDSIGTAIERLLARPTINQESVMLCVITDGEENASTKYDTADIRRLITRVQGKSNWTLVFNLPPYKKDAFCRRYGIPEGNCREWERTVAGIQQMTQANNTSTRSYYTTAQASAVPVKTSAFFVDLSSVKTSAVKSALNDVSGKLRSIAVPKEAPIREFVEEKTGAPYQIGSCFYQLTKSERLQHHKRVLVKENASGRIYAGDDARKVLGLPAATPFSTVRLKPGNMAGFSIYLESNSTNRLLVRGTSLLMLKTGESLS